jgi:predicted HTH transcriptional regulator
MVEAVSQFKNSLDKLGLLKAGKLLNAAVVLFGKKPQQFLPNAKLRCAAFATTTTSLIVDRQDFEGDLFYLIDKAEEYILKKLIFRKLTKMLFGKELLMLSAIGIIGNMILLILQFLKIGLRLETLVCCMVI